MSKIELTTTAAGGIQIEIEDGNSVKNLILTAGELSQLGPRLATLAEDASLKIKQKEIEENDQIPDDDVPASEPDDNDFIPD